MKLKHRISQKLLIGQNFEHGLKHYMLRSYNLLKNIPVCYIHNEIK